MENMISIREFVRMSEFELEDFLTAWLRRAEISSEQHPNLMTHAQWLESMAKFRRERRAQLQERALRS